ncbi:MAG: winged helix-turn-helix domain-containing protein [Candidatus Bathyarchaeia archaeon]|jgi:hypothetical protein
MTVEFSALHKILKDKTRRTILKCLNDNGPMSYVELMKLAEVANTGRFNYHLKALGGLIEKQGDGRYGLTERGHLAVQLLDKFPENGFQKGERKKNWKKAVGILAIACIIVASISVYWYNNQLELAKPVALSYTGNLMDITNNPNGGDWSQISHNYGVGLNLNTTGVLYNGKVSISYLATNGSWIQMPTKELGTVDNFAADTGVMFFTKNCQYVPGTKYATPFYFTDADNLTVIRIEAYGYRAP